MNSSTDEFRKHVNELWSQTVDQLETLKDTVLRSTNDRVETEVQRLRMERDKLLQNLGEQTLKLINQEKVPVPAVVKKTVDRLNSVLDSLMSVEAQRSKGKGKGKKKATKAKSAAKGTSKKKSAAPKRAATKKAPAVKTAGKKTSAAKTTAKKRKSKATKSTGSSRASSNSSNA